MSESNGTFADYLTDMLTSQIAVSEDCHDFIVRQGDNELVYVDIDNNALWLVTVERGVATVSNTEERP